MSPSCREKKEKAQEIRSNVLEGIATLTKHLDELGIELGREENHVAKDYILNIQSEDFTFSDVSREGRSEGEGENWG